jgi:hypothetical protein
MSRDVTKATTGCRVSCVVLAPRIKPSRKGDGPSAIDLSAVEIRESTAGALSDRSAVNAYYPLGCVPNLPLAIFRRTVEDPVDNRLILARHHGKYCAITVLHQIGAGARVCWLDRSALSY